MKSRNKWIEFMKENLSITTSTQSFTFGNTIIYNDYEKYIDKVVHSFKSI